MPFILKGCPKLLGLRAGPKSALAHLSLVLLEKSVVTLPLHLKQSSARFSFHSFVLVQEFTPSHVSWSLNLAFLPELIFMSSVKVHNGNPIILLFHCFPAPKPVLGAAVLYVCLSKSCIKPFQLREARTPYLCNAISVVVCLSRD